MNQLEEFARFNKYRQRRDGLSGEGRSLGAMMPMGGMIELRSRLVLVHLLFDIEMGMQLAAFFGCMRMEEGLVYQPYQKAGDTVSHGCGAAHTGYSVGRAGASQ